MRALLLLLMPVLCQAKLTVPVETLPSGHSAGIIVSNGAELIAHNPDTLYPPASTLKLLTALAAKLHWPGDFHITTALYKRGKDYTVRFSGDPSLSRDDLAKLLAPLKGKVIAGDLWLDDSLFTGYDRAVGWPWDVLGVCYAAPASAMALEGNCVQASLSTRRNGTTSTFVPKHQPITLSTQARRVSKEQQQNEFCSLDLKATPYNHYQLSGCITPLEKPLPLKLAVQSPELYVRDVITQLFKEQKTRLKGKIRTGARLKGAELISSHHSEPLDTLLTVMLQDSNNLYADNLTKLLGADYFSTSGSFNSGTAAIRAILLDRAGIDLGNAVLEDGSGLSRNNRLSPRTMLETLEYIRANDKALGLIALLPVAGESGTLQYRKSMRKAPIKGNIKGKSGSLFGAKNMVGYTLNGQGQPRHSFVQYISSYHPPESKPGTEAPITRFEKQFYQSMLQQAAQ